jgi:hypothetical protein
MATEAEQKIVAETLCKLTELGYPAVANHDFSQIKIYGSDLVDPNSPLKRRGV